ncbi:MAG: GTP-binding protein [Candidatus Micrarchaeia archaeon]
MQIYKVALLGDKDHGKSTAIGNLLMLTKSVSGARIEEAKRISKELGRPFEPGFILDSFSEEREGAMTIDTTRAQMRYRGAGFEFIDVPGHEELITNMLTGASSAGTAVLIVSAKKGEGVSDQTRRHLLLARMLGIVSVVVAVNKMDTTGYSKDAFEMVRGSLNALIANAGNTVGSIEATFVPISAYNGDNLIKRSKNMKWYNGKPLAALLVEFAAKAGARKKGGLRAVVQGSIEGGGTACRIISGSIKRGNEVLALPSGARLNVERVVSAGRSVPSAGAGSAPVLKLGGGSASRGSVLCTSGDRPLVGKSAGALLFLVKRPKAPTIKLGTQESRCRIRIERAVDITSGAFCNEKTVKPLGIYSATMDFAATLAYERFEKLTELGRFTLHENGRLVGVGIIEQ